MSNTCACKIQSTLDLVSADVCLTVIRASLFLSCVFIGCWCFLLCRKKSSLTVCVKTVASVAWSLLRADKIQSEIDRKVSEVVVTRAQRSWEFVVLVGVWSNLSLLRPLASLIHSGLWHVSDDEAMDVTWFSGIQLLRFIAGVRWSLQPAHNAEDTVHVGNVQCSAAVECAAQP